MLKQIRKTSITPLWVNGYWDGILSGHGMYRGKPVYFNIDHDYPSEGSRHLPRKYIVYELSPEAWAYEQEKHAAFCKWIGTHCNLDKDWNRCIGEVHPNFDENKDQFYGKYEKSFPLGRALGYFFQYDWKKARQYKRAWQREWALYRD